MLETELNDAESSDEGRNGASSPEVNTAAGGPPPAGDDQPAAAKSRRRVSRSRAGASSTDAGASSTDAGASSTDDGAPPGGATAADAGHGPDAGSPSAVRFAGPPAERPAADGAASAPAGERSAIPAATFQPPQVIFQPPPVAETADTGGQGRRPAGAAAGSEGGNAGGRSRKPAGAAATGAATTGAATTGAAATGAAAAEASGEAAGPGTADHEDGEVDGTGRRRRRRGSRSRGQAADGEAGQETAAKGGGRAADDTAAEDADAQAGEDDSRRRRRRRRRSSSPEADQAGPDEPANTVVHVRPGRADEPSGEVQQVRGSTRLEAKRQRRREGRDSGRRRPPVITESEFLARREAVDRIMVVRQRGERTQIGVLEDGVLVEHYVDKASHQSFVGNVYLGKVQNVLPSMEAAFVDIGKGRNAVLYAGEVNFDASGLEGESKRIESALKSGQSVLVQVTKDPVGHKGARLTSQVSLPGRYLVYVPGGSMMGISRKLPDKERARLKQILKQVMPEGAGVIVRTAAEGASEEELSHDVARLSAQWETIDRKAKSANAPELLYSEPDLTIRVVRDIFNEDFSNLVVSGDQGWDLVDEYVHYVAPHLADRLDHWHDEQDAFAHYRIDEQLSKALDRKVWLPSGGSLVIDTTEAMTVVDVNTGKFTGQGGNLEETVTRNNLEAAEEIVRQLRLRDVGGIIVIDFIDMVLESNRELVLRRLLECLARDRTKHQVAEVTSLGLVQMTRKRVGSGLLEAFSEPCDCCNGRGVLVSLDLIERGNGSHRGRGDGRGAKDGRQAKDGKEADRRKTPEPVGAGQAGAGGEAAEAGQAAGDGGDGTEEPAGRASGGRRRRRAATREQGPPEPAAEISVQLPDLPEAGAPEAGAGEPGALEAGAPDVSAPEASAPEASAPEIGAPEAGAPEVSAPDVSAPEASAAGSYTYGPDPYLPVSYAGDSSLPDERAIAAQTPDHHPAAGPPPEAAAG